ncbi:Alpha-L-Rha alpha-1,3-L-rhamnosyltransferase [Photobacterium marinum]|uniref:Alpha-L-Rha alpha-1,3-L-rhamnosyltransferase n=1 Tax=Photobacterium marinum TaxID=1056511 RepID=L8JBX2_9GAMM|nr:glycosyltransferase family 2 protein [Photobacterium marinum]ELR65064.1 Alpha-L-Rha alpha-1,3-L-rhamnosyltransferase [Photobacterium marinum]
MNFSYSVLICTYNGEKYIEQQIESIINQKIKPDFYYISDDGSSDLTINKVIELFKRYHVSNYVILNGPKRGPSQNFLTSIIDNKSQFLFLADQDDLWCCNKIDEFIKCLKSSDKPIVWYSDSYLIDEYGRQFSDSFFKYQGLNSNVFLDDSIIYKNCVQGATCCINLSMCKLISKTLETVPLDNILMHDWWIALLAKYFGESVFIDKPLVKYRQHSTNEVGASSKLINILKLFTNPLLYWERYKKVQVQHMTFVEFCSNFEHTPLIEGFSCSLNGKNKNELSFKYCGYLKIFLIRFSNWRLKHLM